MDTIKERALRAAWVKRNEQRAAGEALCARGEAERAQVAEHLVDGQITAAGNRHADEADRLCAEGRQLVHAGALIFIDAVIAALGERALIAWAADGGCTVDGVTFSV